MLTVFITVCWHLSSPSSFLLTVLYLDNRKFSSDWHKTLILPFLKPNKCGTFPQDYCFIAHFKTCITSAFVNAVIFSSPIEAIWYHMAVPYSPPVVFSWHTWVSYKFLALRLRFPCQNRLLSLSTVRTCPIRKCAQYHLIPPCMLMIVCSTSRVLVIPVCRWFNYLCFRPVYIYSPPNSTMSLFWATNHSLCFSASKSFSILSHIYRYLSSNTIPLASSHNVILDSKLLWSMYLFFSSNFYNKL